MGCHSSAFGYKVLWTLVSGKIVRNGMEMQHTLLRFAGACTPAYLDPVGGPGKQNAGLGDSLARRDSGMFLISETSLLAGGS